MQPLHHKQTSLSLVLIASLIAALVVLLPAQPAKAAAQTFTNATSAQVDNASDTRSVVVSGFDPAAVVTDVNIAVTFQKITNEDCNNPDTVGSQGTREIEFILSSPVSSVTLVAPDTYSANGPASPFTVTFDDGAAGALTAQPMAGTYQPVGSLADFNGQSPNGTWTLGIRDDTNQNALCFISYDLTIDTDMGLIDPGDPGQPGQPGQPGTAAVAPITWDPVPACSDVGGEPNSIVYAMVPDAAVPTNANVYCRVLVENGAFLQPSAQIGVAEVFTMTLLQAVEVFALDGGSSIVPFNQAVNVCLQGTGRVLFLDAAGMPRVIGWPPSWQSDGYTCATISGGGTVVLVQ